MNPLPNLPVFLRLAGRRAALAGNGEAAAWKAELLVAAGAEVVLFAPAPSARLAAVAAARREPRSWRAADLEGAAIAVLEAQDDGEAERFLAAGRAAGALVNVIDRPRYCDCSFGSIVERAPLVIGVSTDGAAPVFAQAVRSRIEALFPDSLRLWAEAARAWRGRFAGHDLARRRAIWLDFAAAAFASVDRAPTEADFAALSQRAPRPGRLIVVGAGPGDVDMLTLRAMRALQAADHVIEDGPVAEALRELGRREATFERWPKGADAGARARAATRVAEGAVVVVLTPGDGRRTAWTGAEIVAGVAR